MARSLRFDQKGLDHRDSFICENQDCEIRRRKTVRELNIAKYRIRELEKYSNRDSIDVLICNDKEKEALESKQQQTQHNHQADGFATEETQRNKDFETIL